MTATTTKKAPGRPRSPLDVAEAQALQRIAGLSVAILKCLRKPGRGARYGSERDLRQFLNDDGIAFAAADLAPAVVLLDSTRKIKRDTVGPEQRPGWMAHRCR